MNRAWFAAGLTFAATVAVVNSQSWPVRSWMILSVGLLLIALRFQSLALVLEVLALDWLGRMPFGSEPVRYTTVVTAVLLLTGYGPSRLTRAFLVPVGVAWFAIVVGMPGGYSPYGWAVLGCAAASLVLSAAD
jgi:hypothetical protein